MTTLYVLYDERCELCKRLKDWLLGQRCWIEMKMVAAGSAKATELFPTLDQLAARGDLVVISDVGEVYLNNHAWIMCLYALDEYRDWALRLASPLLLPLARQAFATLSRHRGTISRWMAASEQDVAYELRQTALETCSATPRLPNMYLAHNVSDYLR